MAILEITDPTTTTTEATTTTTEGMTIWNTKIRKKIQGKNLFHVNIVVQRTFLNSRSLQFNNLFWKYTLLLCWRNMWMLRRFIYSNFWNKCHSRILQLRRNVLYWWLMQKYVFLFRYHVIRSEVALYKAHFLIRLEIFLCFKFVFKLLTADGGFTDWTTWACPNPCYTNPVSPQTRTRTCTNPEPANDGADCSGALSESGTNCDQGSWPYLD